MIEQEQYQAVFSNPHNDLKEYGPIRDSVQAALQDRAPRSEGTHGYLSGIRVREVTPWRDVPLETIIRLGKASL